MSVSSPNEATINKQKEILFENICEQINPNRQYRFNKLRSETGRLTGTFDVMKQSGGVITQKLQNSKTVKVEFSFEHHGEKDQDQVFVLFNTGNIVKPNKKEPNNTFCSENGEKISKVEKPSPFVKSMILTSKKETGFVTKEDFLTQDLNKKGFGEGKHNVWSYLKEKDLVDIKEYYNKGGSLYIFGDNDPYFVDANRISEMLFSVKLTGNDFGNNKITQVNMNSDNKTGFDPKSPIFSGIESLFEGITVSYLLDCQELVPLMWGTENHVIAAAYDKDGHRFVIDGGFTRIFYNWDEDTRRFVINVIGWLSKIDLRFQ